MASIDIGTNSVLLLVAEHVEGRLQAVVERAVVTRLGLGVDRTRRLDDEASRRTLECLKSFADELDHLGVIDRWVVGTSALRDVQGGNGFLDEAETIIGARPRVLSGIEEAQLTFIGALSGLNLCGSVAVFDVGGGSTEISQGRIATSSTQISRAISLDIGAVRLHERHVKHDPPLLKELLAVQNQVRSTLADLGGQDASRVVVGVAGTVTTLFAVSHQVAPYEGERVHGGQLSREAVQSWSEVFARLPLSERVTIPGLEPRRADVIGTGALIVLEIMEWLRADHIVVSSRGLRWGIIERNMRNAPVQSH